LRSVVVEHEMQGRPTRVVEADVLEGLHLALILDGVVRFADYAGIALADCPGFTRDHAEDLFDKLPKDPPAEWSDFRPFRSVNVSPADTAKSFCQVIGELFITDLLDDEARWSLLRRVPVYAPAFAKGIAIQSRLIEKAGSLEFPGARKFLEVVPMSEEQFRALWSGPRAAPDSASWGVRNSLVLRPDIPLDLLEEALRNPTRLDALAGTFAIQPSEAKLGVLASALIRYTRMRSSLATACWEMFCRNPAVSHGMAVHMHRMLREEVAGWGEMDLVARLDRAASRLAARGQAEPASGCSVATAGPA
jgi:hypothetical protein